MIPTKITREEILAALAIIGRKELPPGRRATRYLLQHDGKTYPPKYVISLAAKIATGEELLPSSFNGGAESNRFLNARGFTIVPIAQLPPTPKPGIPRRSARKPKVLPAGPSPPHKPHDERCPACKATVLALLKSLYGETHANHGMEVGATPEGFIGTPHYDTLKKIYEALQERRGFLEFVRTTRLPHCDFFVPKPGFVVEFDESQHFTAARADALQLYPKDLRLGFDREEWINRCREIAAKDNDPPFRDEQRAWYDTLRDFLPDIKGLRPTVRLYAKHHAWCGLNPSCPQDRDTFRRISAARSDFWSVEIRAYPDAVLARLVIDGIWNGEAMLAKAVLRDVCERWSGKPKVKCLSTCGAFLTFDFPHDMPAVRDNLNPSAEAVRRLIASANKVCDQLLDEAAIQILRSVCDYLSFGVDSRKRLVSTTRNLISEPHVELVCVVNLRTGERHWTGKSYPTSSQAGKIIRFPDLNSHFLALDGTRTMVLGCHDITVFNPRSQAKSSGWRKEVSEAFRVLAKEYAPVFVLHHPHTATKSRTWSHAWAGLHRELPSVEHSVGTGAYWMADSGWDRISRLDDVLAATKRGSVVDVVARVGGAPDQ